MPEPERAELYAVYFGTAFHLGVYIGDGKVVHYLNDDHVHEVTWEQFLEGRTPQHWTYPDLPPLPAEEVVATALAEVGKTTRTTCSSSTARISRSSASREAHEAVEIRADRRRRVDVGSHPLLGTVAELNTRVVEWLAFHFGGPAGKNLSLTIRRVVPS